MAKIANNVAGCGSAFPNFSVTFKKRSVQLRFFFKVFCMLVSWLSFSIGKPIEPQKKVKSRDTANKNQV